MVLTTTTTDGSNLSANFTLEVNNNAYFSSVEGITLNPSNRTIKANSAFQVNALFTPGVPSNRQITWKSSDPSVAEIYKVGDSKCQVSTKKEGTAIITATTVDGNKVVSMTVTVTN